MRSERRFKNGGKLFWGKLLNKLMQELELYEFLIDERNATKAALEASEYYVEKARDKGFDIELNKWKFKQELLTADLDKQVSKAKLLRVSILNRLEKVPTSTISQENMDIFKNIALEWADFDDVAGWLDRPVGVVIQEYNNMWLILRKMEI